MANSVNLPAGFGGLTRFNEEYESRFNLRPLHVVMFVVLVVGIRMALPYIF